MATGCGASDAPSSPRVVTAALSGHLVELSTGERVRLAGVRAPYGPRGDVDAEPGFAAARDALAALCVGRPVRIAPDGPATVFDRYGNRLGVVWAGEDGDSLQARLTADGWARVRPEAPSNPHHAAWFAAEDAARAAARGVWASPYYTVRTPDTVAPAVGSFQIVQGLVVDAAAAGGRWFLNFGADYRTDFTVVVERDHRSQFDEAAWFALVGAPVQARGMVERWNGPLIRVRHRDQVRRLAPINSPG